MDYEKKYKEALERAKVIYQGSYKPDTAATIAETLQNVFPELCESKDERIRKELIEFVKSRGGFKQEYIAWLEKQGSQNNTEDEDLLYRFCFYSYKDESNILYLSGLYVNGECRNKGIGTKILEVADEVAKNLNCYAIRLKTEIGSNAERLYRRNGYNTFKREGNNVWLEKQGEQKPFDYENANIQQNDFAPKVEPKFKVGNWYQCTKDFFGKGVTFDKNTAYYCAKEGCLQCEYGCHIAIVKNLYDNFKLWTIQDAEDGDVLAFDNNTIVIFKDLYNATTFHSYCHIEDGLFGVSKDEMPDWWEGKGFHPATKEQRDLLFAKMKESGYEWLEETKELKKIEQKPAWNEEELTDFEKSLKHVMEETLECGDIHNLKADADLLLRLVKPTDDDMKEALRTEYEKGRADVIADTISWLENCWPRYCSNQTIIKGFKEAIKGE